MQTEKPSNGTISKEFAAALIKARLSLKAPGKDGSNPHFKSSYMTLDNLTASVMDAMEPNGLMVMQHPFSMSDEGGLCVGVETIVLHESGQTLSSGRDFFCRVVGGDAQKVGAAVTYLRRYGLGAMLGVVVQEDDDGQGVSGRPQPRQQNPPAKPTRPIAEQGAQKQQPAKNEAAATDSRPSIVKPQTANTLGGQKLLEIKAAIGMSDAEFIQLVERDYGLAAETIAWAADEITVENQRELFAKLRAKQTKAA